MQIRQLSLIQYRNYEKANFEFCPGTNILYGLNGQGKTNLLESIFVLCRGYSHRTGHFQDLVIFDQEQMSLSAKVESMNTLHQIRMIFSQNKKKWELDAKKEKGFSRINRLTGCILFEPDDLEIVKAGPERRRRFMNEELSGLNPVYRASFREYEKIRSQRNALLKSLKKQHLPLDQCAALLDVWDTQLAKAAKKVFEERSQYLLKLNKEAKILYQKLSDTKESLSLQYQSNVFSNFQDLNQIEQIYLKRLKETTAQDIERGYTQIGPHADELVIQINGKPARQFASQGQQRSAAISLKLAHIELYRQIHHQTPIVLLDDILSELDENRQKNLLTLLEDCQAFITCTDPAYADEIEKRRLTLNGQLQPIKKFQIDSGQILKTSEIQTEPKQKEQNE